MAETRKGNDAGVDTTQDHLLHDHALEAVPRNRRRGLYQMIAVWIGWAISLSAFLVGGVVGAGTTFAQGMVAIVLGNAILAVIGGLIGLIGYRTGLTSYLLARIAFGRYGSVVASVVLGVLAMGFIGVLLDAFGTAFSTLVPALPWTAVVLLFAVVVTVTAIFGFKGLAFISAIAAPAMLVLALLGLIRLGSSEGGFGTVLSAQPSEPIGFPVAITAVIATWITGAALSADIARYARRGWHVMAGAFAGYVLGAGFFEASATVSAMEVGNPNFVAVMNTLGLLLPATLVVLLALWTTTDNNLYSSALAFTNASKLLGAAVPKYVWTIVSILLAVGVAFLGLAARFLTFLNVIATVAPPFAGIIITHFWVLGGLRVAPDRQLEELPAVRWSALVAWAAATAVVYFTDLPLAPVVGLVLGGVFYAVLALMEGPRRPAGGRASTADNVSP